ncbi:hypothetical protein [Shewanella sp. MM_2022_3]|uniref:hypothetical protein n=1 Tax=Shewanella sp. MM_2022_3 TaxID=2923280 RepID=UPI001F4C1B3C|nr:hypothetical protein [Shewanella sp. MM_2022_3]MCH7421291.1 hypothetical protein [Shewanella sp. MM_2022_3]
MNDKEWEELLKARFEEIILAIKTLNLTGEQSLNDCEEAVKGVIGIRLDDSGYCMRDVSASLYWRKDGTMTLDEAVTHLNNLPLGLKIANLQRAEVLEDDPQLVEAVELQEEAEKSLEQLCDEYEDGLVEGKHSPEAVAYIMALEDLVSEMQGKSFADSSRIGQLEAENAELKARVLC